MSDYRAGEERLDRQLEPAVSALKTGGHGKFVAAVLVACFALLTSVLALNVLVDPFALAGTGLLPAAVETDRSIKLNLIEELPRNPEILILGSSRARQAEPSFLKRLTGHTGFNAAVTGGTAADGWVMTRYAADRFPHARRRYLWFVESGIATNGINPQLSEDPRASRYLAGKSVQFGLHQVGEYISLQATRASLRVIKACVVGTCKTRVRYRADGSIAEPTLKYLPEHARSLRRSVAKLVASIKSRPPRHPNVNPARYEFFEKALAFMNKHGARPVIVLNPIHPKVLAALRERGFPAHKASLAYLHALHRRFDFVVVDCQDIRRWGGSSQDFANATHVNLHNMRRMLRYIVAHSEGALN
ncbi:MAG: hypothetical protein M3R37_04325 [Actinomycetota bacterium]|nr:hypothetical protein [Actinomycetota bacterium]